VNAKGKMTASQWREWARVRRRDADTVRQRYLNQAKATEEMLDRLFCACDPLIVLHSTPEGPTFANPQVIHSLECDR